MSRVGKKPIDIEKGVEVKTGPGDISVKGPKGTLSIRIHDGIKVTSGDGKIIVERANDSKELKALHGLHRALIANMITGVSKGFEKTLELSGVGYKALKQGKNVVLSVGYSHTVEIKPPEGIELQVEGVNKVKVLGIDKELVGQVAANIREVKPPEPYKGKGIKYINEVIRRKAGKVAKVGAAAA